MATTHSTSEKIVILFLAANPSTTTRLRLDEEVRAIDQVLRQADYRDEFDLRQHWAVRVADLQELLLRHKPQIVHFSGHGSQAGQLLLEDDRGREYAVPPEALSQLFSILRDNLRCVVLNACYSERQAKAIAAHIDCVVGIPEVIGDIASRNFAASFYQALAYGRDMQTAFDLGSNRIDLQALDESSKPKLLAWYGDPRQVVFAAMRRDTGDLPPLASLFPPREDRRQRMLDAAMPSSAQVGRATELLAMVRRPISGGLRVRLEVEDDYMSTPDDVRTRSFEVNFPIDKQGTVRAARLLVRVVANDFMPPMQEKKIVIPTDGDSGIVTFQLTPRKQGKLTVHVELHEGGIFVGTGVLHTNVEMEGIPASAFVQQKYRIASIPFQVEVEPRPVNWLRRVGASVATMLVIGALIVLGKSNVRRDLVAWLNPSVVTAVAMATSTSASTLSAEETQTHTASAIGTGSVVSPVLASTPSATATPSATPTPTATAAVLTVLNLADGDLAPYASSLLGTYPENQEEVIRVFVVPPPVAGGSSARLYPQSYNHCEGNDGAAMQGGRWEQHIQVGLPIEQDVGQPFEIVVTTATAEGNAAVVAEIQRWCDDPEKKWPGFAELPDGVDEVERIMVIRSDEILRAPDLSGVQLPGALRITSPRDGQTVTDSQTASGIYSNVPPDHAIWVLVYTIWGKWLPQSSNACAGEHTIIENGQWRVASSFQTNTNDEPFDVVAVVADPEASDFFDQKQRELCAQATATPDFRWLGLHTIDLPAGIAEKDRIQVIHE